MNLENIIAEKLNEKIITFHPLFGGDINKVYKIETVKNTYVLKLNLQNSYPKMLEKEKKGLISIAETGVKTPKIIHCFTYLDFQFLILEFISEESINPFFWENFARKLATLHQKSNTFFGLEYDNYIGSLSQKNTPNNSWQNFFIENRLEPLVKKAFDLQLLEHHHLTDFKLLYTKLNNLLPIEKPSLLHGDLWLGNLLCEKHQNPVFIDPAIYFGNREVDIAMTQLFGGFDNSFLTFYNKIFPLKKGWEERIGIYNLYPRLVHLILFGKSYLIGIENVLRNF